MKRICLFAGYDANNIIHDYVLYYISELSKVSDVYYISDNNMLEDELCKLKGITKKSFSIQHKKYDFGSWQKLINLIGWSEIEKYDQLILANDSCYGPFFDLEAILESNESKYDFWGLTENYDTSYHIQSYFLVLNRKVMLNTKLRYFFENIRQEKNQGDVVRKYEYGITSLMCEEGFKVGAHVQNNSNLNLTTYPVMLIRKYNYPFVKIKVLTGSMPSMNLYGTVIKVIHKYTNYNIALIEKHILLKYPSLLKIKVKVFMWFLNSKGLPSWVFFGKITNKGKLLIKIFKIPVFNFKIKW